MKYESRVGEVLEEITDEILSTDIFEGTPIFYDFIEVDANNVPPTCIIYKPLEATLDKSACNFERQLDIILLITTEERREGIIGQLHKYSEKLYECINGMKINNLDFLQISPIHARAYNRESIDSYKETKQLFSSMIVLSYLLRY